MVLMCLPHSSLNPQARVEEKRLAKEAQYWGRTAPPKRDLPAFWSISTHGQPFNDERVAQVCIGAC